MKKLFLLITLLSPFVLFGQLMDTATVFFENFDGSSFHVSTSYSPSLGGTNGDWSLNDTLYVSVPNSFHTPVYSSSGNSSATTDAIPLAGSTVSNLNKIYFSFDQICKVNSLDNATIYYEVANGIDEEGNYIWEPWRLLNFNNNSPFYLGSGTNYTAGKFNDACYNVWNSNTLNAIPNNTWWRNEYFDITDFIIPENETAPTHFRLQFRCNKISPSSSGTNVCKGWYLDNIKIVYSNCELIKPGIKLLNPKYEYANNNTLNNVGPYPVTAEITDNDTVNLNSLLFTYSRNNGPWDTIQNTITLNTLNASGHTIKGLWTLPSICYGDTIRYKIYVEDTHGNEKLLETWLTAHHNQTNIRENDCRLDSLNTFPYCLITGVNQDVTLYFTNRSDPAHSISTGSNYQTNLSVTMQVENENHVITHNSTHTWTGNICFDWQDSLSLGHFTPTHGYNYVTVFVNSRNNEPDGNHINDTLKLIPYSCDSLLHGDYTVGGADADFTDMAAVKSSLLYCGVDGPANFHLRPGTYQDFDFTENYPGQSDVNTITFTGDNVDSVFIINNHTDAGNAVFGAVTLVNVSNFRFVNLTITGNDVPVSRGVVLRGNSNADIIFDGCNITAFPTNSTATTSCAVSRVAAANIKPDTVTFRNCNITGGNFGIYYIGTSARRNDLTIQNCNITSCYRGININFCNSVIEKNHINQCYNSQNNYLEFSGIYAQNAIGIDINGNIVDSVFNTEYGIFLKSATLADFYIRNNRIKVGDSKYGIYIGNSSSTTSGNIITGYLYNNEVILYPVIATASYAMMIESCNYLQVANNSLFVKSDAPYSNTAAIMIKNNNTTYFDNNLLINQCNCSDNTDYPIYLNNTSTIVGNYNDYVSSSGIIGYKAVTRHSIEEWEGAVTTTTNNISLLPPMTDPTDSLLPVNFTGLECPLNANVPTDIRGIVRNGLTYMGVYADPIANTDAAIIAMTNPVSGTCPEASYDITVSIANKGSEVLNFANHPATLQVISTALNLNNTVNISSDTIALLSSIDKVVAHNIPIPINQNIDFTFIVTTTGDANPLNDTLRTYFTMEVIIPDYEEDFSHGTRQTWTIRQLDGAGNWTFQEGTGSDPDISPVSGTGRLFFNSHSFSNSTISRAIMPVIVLDSSTNPILEIWMAQDNGYSANSYSNLEGVTVKVSTNDGLTFSDLIPEEQNTALLKRYNAAAPSTGMWRLFTYDLSPYVANSCIKIALDARSRKGNNINIDRIRVRNLFSNDIGITRIYAQGETSTQLNMKNVISALIQNEGRQNQSDINVYLNVTGAAEQYRDTITIESLAYRDNTLVVFPDHLYNVNEVKNVEVRVESDEMNSNNKADWRMVTTAKTVNYADTSAVGLKTGDYQTVIRPCVRYKMNQELAITDVKYYYDASYIQNPEEGFQAFVSNADGEIIATSDIIYFDTLESGNWYTIPINNFALTNMTGAFYVGITMLAQGDYLCSQIETPLRDSTFFYLESDGTYTPQTFGRFMIGAVVDKPHKQDLAILSLLHPVSDCDLGHEHITLEITNNGSEIIPPGTILHYTINNGPIVTQTLQDTLPIHEIVTFAFDTVYDFTNHLSTDVTYHIRAWTTLVELDRLQYNDTLQIDIVSKGKAEMPIVPDTILVNYHTTGTITPQLPPSITQGLFGWYTSSGFETWNFHGYGDTYTTPEIFFDTTYYVTAVPGYIFDTVVGTGTLSGTHPFIFNSGYSRGRILYKQDEIGDYGTITSLGLYVQTKANGANGIPIRIYLKESDLNAFPVTVPFDWEAEKSGAQLVFDGRIYFDQTGWHEIVLPIPFEYTSGNLIVLTETNCADYCTGSGTQCNNCGNFVSGGTRYPAFRMTNTGNGLVQYKNGNTSSMSGNFSNYARRLNMQFQIANVDCSSEKVPIYIHVPDIPNHDVKTDSLIYPTGSCTMGNEFIQVKITNLLNSPIPPNKVVIHAVFNGTEITHTVDEEFGSQEVKNVTFTTPFDFSAPTANTTFHYTIFTTLNDETIVYRPNDTIRGSFVSKYTYPVPSVIDYTSGYTETFTVQPTPLTTHYFYHNEDDETPFLTAASWTTPVLYDTLTLWVSGKTNTSNCETERIRVNINVFTPLYDMITNELISPVSYQCGIANSPYIEVNIGNTDTTSSSTIPAGTFELTAQFTGTHTANGTSTVTTPISSLQNSTFTFDNGISIGSNTQNNSYTYYIYNNPVDNTLGVYRGNDTISGTLFIPANPVTPPALNYTTNYGNTYTVSPNSNILDYYYFYHNNTDNESFAEGNSFVTEPLYAATTTYYYSGRIEDDDFDTTYQVGTGNVNQQSPFAFNQGHSAGIVLYSASEIGGIAGRIDSIYLYVSAENTSGATIPIKMWLKNVPDANQIASGPRSITWDTMTSSAQLILDADLSFDAVGWFAIAVPGGFDYTGGGLYLLTEHDCGSSSCVITYGVNPIPNFKETYITKKVLLKSNNTGITGTQSFALNNYRPNTKFKFNYTCESPKGIITVNTSVPSRDAGVTEIITPVSQNNSYTTNEQVQVTIKNFGTQSIANIPIYYQLGNDAAVSQTYSGTLAPGASATVTFTSTVDLTPVYYATPLKAFTGLSNDAWHNNDTVTITVSKEDPCISRPLTLATGVDISNVTISNVNNGPGTPFLNYDPQPNNGMYTDYTSDVEPVFLVLGQTYPLSITHSFTTQTATQVFKRVYIDYDRNGVFDDNENVFSSGPISNDPFNATTATSITIPFTAEVGLTRMRVICAAGNVNSPCGTYNYAGETEDYAVEIAQRYRVDIGIVEYQHPVGEVCPDANGKIRIIVRNFGQNTQSFSGAEPLSLTTTVSGPVPTTSYNVSMTSGSLTPNEQTTLIMDNVNLSQQGTYHLTTLLTFNGDQYYFNDTMSITAIVPSSIIISLPFTDNFDQNTGTDELHFTSDWTLDFSASNYKWEVKQGASPNNQYNVGPESDHTQYNTLLSEYGRYASVLGKNSNYNLSYPPWTSITTGCLDLHYHNGYPVEISFYKHFLGASNADFLMTVEVGSGKHFIVMDTLTKADGTQILYADPWNFHNTTLIGYDEVGRVKFKVTKQKYRIDPSIDDIEIREGLPDLALISVLYPYDFRDSINHPDACLVYQDSIYPIVKIKNVGFTPVQNYDVMCIAKIGAIFDTITEHVNVELFPEDTLTYAFEHPFVVPEHGTHLEVAIYVLTPLDLDLSNNTKRVIACTGVSVDSYNIQNGVVLNQNVPNPATGKTRISYLVPDFGTAKLNIYSVTGQILYSVSQEAAMGENHIDINTSHFAAGIYYYSLQYKDVILTRKMVIQK